MFNETKEVFKDWDFFWVRRTNIIDGIMGVLFGYPFCLLGAIEVDIYYLLKSLLKLILGAE